MIPTHIILHHSLTADGYTVSWGPIRRYHTQDLGWRDIGYHFGIERVGDYLEILCGRQPYDTGAHTKGMNGKAIGICFVGNFDKAPPPDGVWQKGLELCEWLCRAFTIPVCNVQGHREYADYKSCPGTQFDLVKFRSELAGRLTKGVL